MSKKKKKCQKYYCQGSAIFQGGDINLVSVVDSRGVQSCNNARSEFVLFLLIISNKDRGWEYNLAGWGY